SPQVRRNTPAFPAQWFTAYSALSPATGLFCHRRLQVATRRLDASVGASGPHGFAVRLRHRSSCEAKASTASRPTFVTMANAPLIEAGRAEDGADLGSSAMPGACDRLTRRAIFA